MKTLKLTNGELDSLKVVIGEAFDAFDFDGYNTDMAANIQSIIDKLDKL